MPDQMENQVFLCQTKIMAAIVGFPTEIILAALTGVTGALIGSSMPNSLAVAHMVKNVANGMQIVAQEALNSEAVNVQ